MGAGCDEGRHLAEGVVPQAVAEVPTREGAKAGAADRLRGACMHIAEQAAGTQHLQAGGKRVFQCRHDGARTWTRRAQHIGAPAVGAVAMHQASDVELEYITDLQRAAAGPGQAAHGRVLPQAAERGLCALHLGGDTGFPGRGNRIARGPGSDVRQRRSHARFGQCCGHAQATDFSRGLETFQGAHHRAGVDPARTRQDGFEQLEVRHRPEVQLQPNARAGQTLCAQLLPQLQERAACIEHRRSRESGGAPGALPGLFHQRRRCLAAGAGQGADVGRLHPVRVGPHLSLAQGDAGRRCKQLRGHSRDRHGRIRGHQGECRTGTPELRCDACGRAGGPGKTLGLGEHQGIQSKLLE